jgi:hypothetical protein
MKDHSDLSPIEEFKEKVVEVLELLNQANLPIVVPESGQSETSKPAVPREDAEVIQQNISGN